MGVFEETVTCVARQYGYRNMRAPIVEHTPLFVRSIGGVTDIVEKEMYSFEDKLNGEKLTLRPELTAGLVRAAIEANRPTTARCASTRWAKCSATSAPKRPLPPVQPVRCRVLRF